jgi:DNA-binding transcriptional regulator/RsmH inhibitor MraZ
MGDYFERKLDDKRRLSIPAELRGEFEGGVVITQGFQNYGKSSAMRNPIKRVSRFEVT